MIIKTEFNSKTNCLKTMELNTFTGMFLVKDDIKGFYTKMMFDTRKAANFYFKSIKF